MFSGVLDYLTRFLFLVSIDLRHWLSFSPVSDYSKIFALYLKLFFNFKHDAHLEIFLYLNIYGRNDSNLI